MRISKLFTPDKLVVSFEVFPPKPTFALDTVFSTIEGLIELQPDFISVTYGAGGSNAGRSLEIADRIRNTYSVRALSHLTCVNASREDIDSMLDEFEQLGVENLLALRGDPPLGETHFTPPADGFAFAADLVSYIADRNRFCIAAAAYPEGHCECTDLANELIYLKQKVEAGVDYLITQLFFDNSLLYRFLERLRADGITCPVMAGIMPVLSATQITRITSLCGVTIPRPLAQLMDKFGANPADMEKAGIDYACRQISDLMVNNIEGIHLYTMNKKEQAKLIMRQTGLRSDKS